MDVEGTDREQVARARAKATVDLVWHVGAFVIVNAAFWVMDLALGDGGLDWALWITALWGFALAFHVLTWLIQGRQLEARKARQYLDDDR